MSVISIPELVSIHSRLLGREIRESVARYYGNLNVSIHSRLLGREIPDAVGNYAFINLFQSTPGF